MPYPAPPGPRMSYDRNGSAVFYHDGTHAPVQFTPSQLLTLNDETDINDFVIPISGQIYVAVLFPQLRDVAAFGLRIGTQGTYVLQSSNNSTNGQNGTWTNVSAAISNTSFDPASPAYRTSYTTQSVPGVQAVRFNVTGLGANTTAYGMHLYGAISSGQTLDRLAFTDMFSNPLAPAALDEGDINQSSSADIQFQVTNMSPTRTASNISVFTETNTDTTPSVPAQYVASLDGQNFSATVVVPNLTPGQSAAITLRRVTPANAALGSWSPRVVARAGAWQ